MSDAPTPVPPATDAPNHPDVAVVVVDRQGDHNLAPALESLAAVSRAYGIEVFALLPVRPGESAPGGGLPLPVRLIAVDDDRPDAVWRARAMAETAADIVEFVDAGRAGSVTWDDVVPRRMGLVRLDREGGLDLRDRLVRFGVPDPIHGQGGHG